MRNPELWKPTKFVLRGGRLRASRDRKECAVASRLAVDRTAALYAEHVPAHCRGRLLDLGCGSVPLHAVYAPYVEGSVCVDWPKTIHQSPNLDLACDLAARLPFVDRCFDTLILSDVLEHVPDPALLWSEMARVLRPRGKLLLNVPFLYRIHEAPHDYYRYTEFALRRFAERSGFDVLVLQAIGGVREVLGDLIAKRLERRPILGKPLALAVQAACFRIGNTKLGAKKTAKTGRTYPLAYFLVAERRA
jgi:SAM-dependent methyltransferase